MGNTSLIAAEWFAKHSHEFNSFHDSNTKPSRPNLTSGVMWVKTNLNGIPFLGRAGSI
jgi:hypothetical protein